MCFEVILDNICPNDWNRTLLKSPMGNIFNTFEYSEYTKRRLKWNPLYLSILDKKGEILARTVVFEYTSRTGKKIPNVLNKFVLKFSNKIKWIYGPIIFSEQQNRIIDYFLEYVNKIGKKFDGSLHPFYHYNITNRKVKSEKWSTFMIDLQQNKDSIQNQMDKKSVLKNIKRSQERGVKIKEIDNNLIPEYHKLLNEFRITSGNTPYQYEDTSELWQLLQPLGFKGYLAIKDGKKIGGITFSFFNGFINEWGIARTQRDADEKLYSQDLLKWKIIEWGLKNNQKFYDLSGFNPNPATKKEQGILRYKKKWGGKQYDFWMIRK